MFKRRVRAPFSVFGCLLKVAAAGWRLGPSCAYGSTVLCVRRADGLILHIKGNQELRPHRLDDGDGRAPGVGIVGLHTVTGYLLFKWRLPSINLI